MAQFDAPARLAPGREGEIHPEYARRIEPLQSRYPQVQQETILDFSVANNTLYEVTFENKYTAQYTSDGTATKQEIAEGLRDAIKADPLMNGRMAATVNGSNLLVLTGRRAGVSTTVTFGANVSLSSSTAAQDAEAIQYARALLRDPSNFGQARVCKAANLAARVVLLTPSVADNEDYTVAVVIDGVTYSATIDSGAGASATSIVNALVAALALPASVVASNDTDRLKLTAQTAGIGFDYSAFATGGQTLAITTAADDNGTVQTDINIAFAGVSGMTDAHQGRTIGSSTPDYRGGGDAINNGKDCRITVAVGAGTPVPDGTVYVGTASGEEGRLYAASGTGRLALSRERARWASQSIQGLAWLDVRAL